MRPEFAIIDEQRHARHTVVTVDTSKATYQQWKWTDLGDFGKRKFENLLVLERAKQRLKIIYV